MKIFKFGVFYDRYCCSVSTRSHSLLRNAKFVIFKKKSINFISNPEKYSQKSLFVNVIN